MKNKDKNHQSPQGDDHPDQSEVAQRAYELYEARGGEPGHDLEDWLRAEREVNKRHEVAHDSSGGNPR